MTTRRKPSRPEAKASWLNQRGIENRLRQALDPYVKPGSRLLVAVSGGPDSVALAHALKGMPYSLLLGHVDHQIRRNSGVDARFVQTLGRDWEIPVRIQRVNAPAYARKQKMGLEEAARDLRYRALDQMARQSECGAIVTAHTANDQAETVLMNFLRGAGGSGLAGIPPYRRLGATPASLPLLRPLLSVWKSEIMLYLQSNSLKFRHDKTNDEWRFHRNRIRHRVLPWLEREAPGLSERLVRTAEILRDEEDFWGALVRSKLTKTARKNAKKFQIDLVQLFGYHKSLARRILRHLKPGLSFQDVEQLLIRLPSLKRVS